MRTIALYLLMVGLPTLGVLGVLRFGERLDVPPHVGGTWRVVSGGGCALTPGDEIDFVQSGEHLSVHLPGRPDVRGSLRAGRLVAEAGATGRSAPGCAQGPVRIDIPVSEPAPARLHGTTAVPDCSDCQASPFEVVRATDEMPVEH